MQPLVSIRSVTKAFPGVLALSDVSLDIATGSVHALMGENGAGKSTLGKVLGGLYAPDSGEILLNGQGVRFRGPQDAVRAGISIIHQELLFSENLSVAENLSLGDMPRRGPWVDQGTMIQRAKSWLAGIDADIDPNRIVGELPISKQQLVQIAGGIGRGARVLVFDEPTSSLTQNETLKLLDLIRGLQRRGITCIYVSHRLEEIFALCDTVTVLRDGKSVATLPVGSVTRDSLVKMMIGRNLAESTPSDRSSAKDGELLRVQDLHSPGKFWDISFSLRPGEILGLAGLVGAGRTEIAQALFGLDDQAQGEIFVGGKRRSVRNPIQAMSYGMGLVPEDRKRHGLVLGMNSRENIALPTLDRRAVLGWVDAKEERAVAQSFFDRMRVKAPTIDSPSAGLSGGNQQKLVLAKWLAADSEVLIVDEPTRGVDVGAKAEIHSLLRDLAKDGKAILLISSDLPELLFLATRILVMRQGRIVSELPGGATEEAVMASMAGLEPTPSATR